MLRIGIVGLGRAGAVHLAAGSLSRAVRIMAVCDPSEEARAVGMAAGCRVYADLDHMLLAEHRAELAAALVLLPGPETIRLCEDKFLAHRFFEERGIASPPTWTADGLPEDPPFPVLVKAREGFGSRNIHRAADADELAFFLRYTAVPSFVQEVCLGEEFSIDVFSDMDGRCLNAIPRTMLLSKGGESIKGVSLKDRELIEHGARVAEVVGVKGPATVQCFREPDGSLPVTDVNTRFGGAFPVPLAAGGRDVGDAGFVVDALERGGDELALGDAVLERAGRGVVEVVVPPAVALGPEHEFAAVAGEAQRLGLDVGVEPLLDERLDVAG